VLIDVEQEQRYWRGKWQTGDGSCIDGERWQEIWTLMLRSYALFLDARRLSLEQAIAEFESQHVDRPSSLSDFDRRLCFAQVWVRCLQRAVASERAGRSGDLARPGRHHARLSDA
jgi:hypothetical protein